MWWAGVAWRDGDFEVAVVDEVGGEVLAPTGFRGRDAVALMELLREYDDRADGGLGTVIESTNGLLDGHLMGLGLRAYRVDPWSLPARPLLGSVPAAALAACAVTDPSALNALSVETGSLSGRGPEFSAEIARSADVERELTRLGQCFERGSGAVPEIAITFDDGPHPAFTPQVLDILRRFEVPATFFCVGLNAHSYPELVARAAEEGHTIGNHTWSHPYLPDLSRDEVLRQVDATNEALTRAAGRAATHLRPPYGSRTPEVLGWLAEHGMTTVLWDVDAQDWARPGTDAIVESVTKDSTDGSCILMHDAGGDRAQTVEALPRILTALLDRGYRFVTVDRLSRAR